MYTENRARSASITMRLFLKVDRALSKLITLLILNKKEFNHFFKSRSSDIVLRKLGNLHQNAKLYNFSKQVAFAVNILYYIYQQNSGKPPK